MPVRLDEQLRDVDQRLIAAPLTDPPVAVGRVGTGVLLLEAGEGADDVAAAWGVDDDARADLLQDEHAGVGAVQAELRPPWALRSAGGNLTEQRAVELNDPGLAVPNPMGCDIVCSPCPGQQPSLRVASWRPASQVKAAE